jgi:serine/threonine protein phosphatase 1
MKIAVIPDIHGHEEALVAILRHCGAVDGGLAWARSGILVVQLGDLIDRGPRVRECVELMMRLKTEAQGDLVVLKGNHEALLLSAADSSQSLAVWLMNGARATLESYGESFDKLCRPGQPHYQWFASLPVKWEYGGVLFAHGGLSKGNPDGTDEEKLLWQRPPLVRGNFQAVVCGHTPTSSGRVEENKGVFQCDIGLGHVPDRKLEYLLLDVEKDGIKDWQAAKVG